MKRIIILVTLTMCISCFSRVYSSYFVPDKMNSTKYWMLDSQGHYYHLRSKCGTDVSLFPLIGMTRIEESGSVIPKRTKERNIELLFMIDSKCEEAVRLSMKGISIVLTDDYSVQFPNSILTEGNVKRDVSKLDEIVIKTSDLDPSGKVFIRVIFNEKFRDTTYRVTLPVVHIGGIVYLHDEVNLYIESKKETRGML